MNECMNERVNEWVNEWMNEWVNEWTNEQMNEWMNEFSFCLSWFEMHYWLCVHKIKHFISLPFSAIIKFFDLSSLIDLGNKYPSFHFDPFHNPCLQAVINVMTLWPTRSKMQLHGRVYTHSAMGHWIDSSW